MRDSDSGDIAVVIPVYNPGEHLVEALTGMTFQDHPPDEIVVIDDGSSEDLSWIGSRFPRVQVVRQPRSGPSVARNRGILATSAEYIAFMDQDDLWSRRKLQLQIAALARYPAAGLCYCDVLPFVGLPPVDDSVELEEPAIHLEGEEPYSTGALIRSLEYFAARFVTPSSVLLRRSVLGSSGLLDPVLPFTGDFDLLIRIGAVSPVVHVPLGLVFYRRHDKNFSYRYDVGRAEVKAMTARYVAYAGWRRDGELAKVARSALKRPRALYAAQAFDCARYAYREGRLAQTAYHLGRAMLFSPAFMASRLTDMSSRR